MFNSNLHSTYEINAIAGRQQELGDRGDAPVAADRGLFVARMDEALLDAVLRMVKLLSHRIVRAIEWLKQHYAAPLRIEQLAATVHMSPSALHHRFKEVTAMSPLQYQKQLRLHEARRLIFTDHIDCAAAGHRVGYESASQFSREYRRLFGAPPRTEVARLRESGLPA
jgi:AraC-like DNA-binding protein